VTAPSRLPPKAPIVLPPEGGRGYAMGRLSARFKADEAETHAGYSVSEWLLEPGQPGVGAHSHDANDEIFYVLEGEAEILVGDTWHASPRDTFVRVPAGVTHDFRNRSNARARILNVFIPGGFERQMPAIVEWFAANGEAEA
jgi:Mannose-6-phosphate isomerase